MSLKRKHANLSADSYAFTKPQLGCDLKIIAGDETFYCDLFTLTQQSEYIAARFKVRSTVLGAENYVIDMKDQDPAHVFTFLCIHYYHQPGPRVHGINVADWAPKVVGIANYLMHWEVIEFILMEHGMMFPIAHAEAIISEYHLEDTCPELVKRYRNELYENSSTKEIAKYLLGVGGAVSAQFKIFMNKALDQTISKIPFGIEDDAYNTGVKNAYLRTLDVDIDTPKFIGSYEEECDTCGLESEYTIVRRFDEESMLVDECIPCLTQYLLSKQ
jgi:hypothetical protein